VLSALPSSCLSFSGCTVPLRSASLPSPSLVGHTHTDTAIHVPACHHLYHPLMRARLLRASQSCPPVASHSNVPLAQHSCNFTLIAFSSLMHYTHIQPRLSLPPPPPRQRFCAALHVCLLLCKSIVLPCRPFRAVLHPTAPLAPAAMRMPAWLVASPAWVADLRRFEQVRMGLLLTRPHLAVCHLPSGRVGRRAGVHRSRLEMPTLAHSQLSVIASLRSEPKRATSLRLLARAFAQSSPALSCGAFSAGAWCSAKVPGSRGSER